MGVNDNDAFAVNFELPAGGSLMQELGQSREWRSLHLRF